MDNGKKNDIGNAWGFFVPPLLNVRISPGFDAETPLAEGASQHGVCRIESSAPGANCWFQGG